MYYAGLIPLTMYLDTEMIESCGKHKFFTDGQTMGLFSQTTVSKVR